MPQNKSKAKLSFLDYQFIFNLGVLPCAYFAFKLGLYFLSLSGFDFPLNLILFVLCFIQFKNASLYTCYKIILLILAIVLLYHDSYIPVLTSDSFDFHGDTFDKISGLFQIVMGFVNFTYIGIFILLAIVIFFINDFIKLETLITVAFIYVLFNNVHTNYLLAKANIEDVKEQVIDSVDIPPQLGEATDANVESYLQHFLDLEKKRVVTFPNSLPNDYESFDIVIVNICSMATDDIIASNMINHSLFKKFDFYFDTFSSVSSYSTPATMRLLRANCGQDTEANMYSDRRPECELVTSLESLGYQSHVYFDHDGVYGNYYKTLNQYAGLPLKLHPLDRLKPQYTSFDGSIIYSDASLFSAYINNIANSKTANNVTVMNLISLHDGNHFYGDKKSAAYEPRLKLLLDDLERFITELEKTHKNTLFVMVPEHGAAIRADKMQIAKLREIPTDKITRIPVSVKFIKGKDEDSTTVEVKGFYSYMALSEMIKRAIETNAFSLENATGKISDVFVDLPQTAFIGEATSAYYMNYHHQDMYKLKGSNWERYHK